MDTNIAAFVREAGAGSVLNVLGVRHVYMASGAETDGSFSLWEDTVPPGAGAPPHTHSREDEGFYILDGELLFELEGKRHRVGAGDFVFGARGRRHGYRNVGDRPARMLVLCAPSGGLDRMFAEFDALTAAGAPDVARLIAIAARYGVTIEPPSP